MTSRPRVIVVFWIPGEEDNWTVTSSTTNSLQQEWLTNAQTRPIFPMHRHPSTSNGCYFCWSCGYYNLFPPVLLPLLLRCCRPLQLHFPFHYVAFQGVTKSSLQLDPVRVYISHLPPSTFLHCPATPGWWRWCISICDTEAEHPTKIGNNILGHQFISFTVPNDLPLWPGNIQSNWTEEARAEMEKRCYMRSSSNRKSVVLFISDAVYR